MKKATFKKIEIADAINLVMAETKSQMMAVTYFVDESQSRTANGKKLLQKRVTLVCNLNHDYQKNVERRTGEEFIPQEMKGKISLGNSTLLSLKDNQPMLYATVYKYAYKVVQHFYDNKPITRAEAIRLDLFAPAYFTPKTTKGRGSVEQSEDFGLISPKWFNIEQFKLNKQKYLLVK